MSELMALAFKHFKGTVLKGNKPAMVKTLSELIKEQPAVLQLALAALATPSPAPPAPAAPPVLAP